MNTRKKFYLFSNILLTVLLWLTGVVNAFSQDYLFDAEVINVEDGLPHRNTHSIVQDAAGFIWVSTQGGISRYNGYQFKTYSNPDLNLSELRIADNLAVDNTNRLWYCESDHVKMSFQSGVIDTRLDSIYTMEAISGGLFTSRDVISLENSRTDANTLFIATRFGVVYKYNEDFEEIYRFSPPFYRHISCIAMPDGSYWLICNGEEFIHIKTGKPLQTITDPSAVKKIVRSQPELMVGAPYNLVRNYWKSGKDTFTSYATARNIPEGMITPLQFHKDYSCYTVQDTLFIRDTLGNLLYRFDASKAMKFGEKITWKTSYSDRQNTLWITTNNGVIKISSRKNPFTILLPKTSVRGIYAEGGKLWIGGHGRNIVRNSRSGTQKEFWMHSFAAVTSFCKDDKEDLWMGNSGSALIRYIPDQDSYVNYYLRPVSELLLRIFQNSETKNYWAGTENGVFRLDTQHKIFKEDSLKEKVKGIEKDDILIPLSLPIASNGVSVRQFYQNKQGIWIVTNKGIFLMDSQKETVIRHYTKTDGLPTDNLNHLYEDTKGIFWLGTKGSGLIRWNLQNNSFHQFTRNDGLSNNTIYAVYEDDFETLWLPSDYGLMAFDKTTATTKVYLPQNGIAHEEFNTHAHFRDKDGTLYFGGLNGVTKFHPKDFQKGYGNEPPLYLARVGVLEEGEAAFTDKTNMYNTTKTIILNPDDRILEVNLMLLDYENSSENQYAYKLAGKQEQWIYTRDNKLSIINPPYGRYDIVIKARGASGQWSENVLTIPMHVKTPFYMQWWFFAAVFLVLVISVLIVIRWRVQKLQKDRKRLEEEVQKRTWKIEQDKIIIEKDKQTIEAQAEELKVLDKAKSRFFSNITHEFRTPLTLIMGPAEQLLKTDLPAAIRSKIQAMKRNSGQLLRLINQLLDLSKLESKGMHIEMAHGDIVRYTQELLKQFQPLIDKKRLQLDFEADATAWKTHFDTDKWHKIIYNLLSNAIKFTPEDGSIKISLQRLQEKGQDHIQLRVKDTGIGIEAAKLPHIFNRFYQADASSTRMQEGTGIGLALVKELTALQNGTIRAKSTVGKGTTFIIQLPIAEVTVSKTPLPLHPETTSLHPLIETITENVYIMPEDKQEKSLIEKLELLIVEDNAEMRAYIRSCIDANTYHISEAANGEQGIEKALKIVPDLIISDVMMPKKDGFELTRAIRKHTATSHIPLILLTARASLESRLKGLERGADAYLTKPFSPEELVLRIKKLIELRKLLQKRYQGFEALPEKDTHFKKEDRFFGKIKEYVLENIADTDLGGEAISRHFAISRTQLYRKLKALTNTTIADYIRLVRLNRAMQLLKEKQINVAEVAYETGFSSPEHFSRAFKKMYGKAPSKI